jgi:hypothetical protein
MVTCCLTDGLQNQKVSSLLHVEVVLCFCSVHLCSGRQIHLIADCPLVNAARPSGPPLLSYYGVQGSTLYVEWSLKIRISSFKSVDRSPRSPCMQ